MNWELFKPWLAQATRDGLRTLGTTLMTYGVIKDGAGLNAFVGAGMTLAGIVWGWWTTGGAQQMSGLLKKLTATATHSDAVKAAEVLPPSAAVDSAVKSASVASVVAKVLIVAFALSAFLAAPSAHAQVRKPAVTGNPISDIKTDFGLNQGVVKLTGNPDKDAQAIWQKIVAASNADLTYASNMAGSANTSASGVRKQCYDAILALNIQVNGEQKDASGNPIPRPDPHLFTDVESLAETIDNLSPQGKLFTSCAGMAQLTKTNVLTLINAIVTGAAGLAAMPIIPGL